MFDTLSEKLQRALGDLRGRGVLGEEAISRAMREVRLALLEADVNFGVVKEFVAQVRERALGEDVRKSLTPGQQVVKIVHEELTELLGSTDSRLAYSQRPPTTILLAGLQGSGKTTAAGKLALLLSKEGRKPALVAADLQRPAAIDQLIQLASLGEKLDALDWFHPDRMASRILGMGDVLTLIERAEAAIEDDEKEELERRMMKGEFTFDDFLSSYKMVRRMGPLQGVLKMIPGLGKQLEGLDEVDERQLARVEGIILSMTPHERRIPHVIDASRRKRIAAGSGTTVEQVNQLIEARKQMAKMMKMVGSGKMPQIPGGAMAGGKSLPVQNPLGGGGPPRPSATRKSKSKRKRKAR